MPENPSYWINQLKQQANLRRLRLFFWIITLGAGFLQVWAARFSMSPDGTCYLDIASAYMRHDWGHAVNAYWSPLFSWLVALCLIIFRPSPYWESTLLHLLNFLALLLALRSFEFFFSGFLRVRKQFGWMDAESETLSELGWWALGYGLFLSTSLYVLSASLTMPDMWVAVLTYLVAGLIVRIWSMGGGWHLFAALGLTLGVAYLTKTFYFPISFVFVAAAWVSTENIRRNTKYAMLALIVFSLLAVPWITTLSRAKRRVTIGDVGKIAAIITVDQLRQALFWQGENKTGTPRHPVRQLLSKPRLYEFGSPVGGSYPPAYDISYWMEGAKFRFSIRGLLTVLRQSAGTLFQLLMSQIEYAVGLLAIFYLIWDNPEWLTQLRDQAYLWVPPLIACASYSIVLVEGRYVAPFILLLWITAYSCVLGVKSGISRRGATALVLAALSITGLRVAKSGSSDLIAVFSHQENVDWVVAEELQNLGIVPGDKVAGLSRVAESQWARLAGVKIVSEIPLGEESAFWTLDAKAKQDVFRVLSGTGAKILVTANPPPTAATEGWVPLRNSGFYAHLLPS